MKTVRSYNKQNDTTYVYEVIDNYWDKEKKQARSKRRLIGKIDPETNEMIPTGSGKKKQEREAQKEADYEARYKEAMEQIAQRDQRIAELEDLLRKYRDQEEDFLKRAEEMLLERRTVLESRRLS